MINVKTPESRNLRELLATTCLTAASGVAGASTIIEGVPPGRANFGSTFETATLLPVGRTTVIGGINAEAGDTIDVFEFQSLVPGTEFQIRAFTQPFDVEGEAGVYFRNSSATVQLGSVDLEGAGVHSPPRSRVTVKLSPRC